MAISALSVSRYAERVEQDARALAGLAADALGAPVPSCPGWELRDLLHHLGSVHRWARRYVAEGMVDMVPEPSETEMLGSGPPDPELAAWLVDGAAELAGALLAAPCDLRCWTFLPAPTPLLFWARRQAHETAIHRVDGEQARGAPSAPPADFAADGLAELFQGFAWRGRRRLRRPEPCSALFEASDQGTSWRLQAGPEGLLVEEGPGPADTLVRGSASRLYQLAWNRARPEAVEVRGSGEFLEWWREAVKVTWG